MPRRTPFFHENDFSVTTPRLVFGPSILLPPGRFRAHFGLRLLSALPRLSRVRLVIDVTRNVGAETVATGRVSWSHRGEPLGEVLEFANEDPGALYEFRIHARGRPIRSRLRFFGVRIELIGGSNARVQRSELHIRAPLSLLVDLIEPRTRTLYARHPF